MASPAGRPSLTGGSRPVVPVGADGWAPSSDRPAPATECFRALGTVAGAMTSELNRVLEDAGVPSSTAFQALTVLFRADGPLPPSTIAGRMVVARPTLTGILKALEHRGLVARSGHPLDRRMQLIELTRTGRRTVAETLPLVHRFEAQLFGGLEARDVATLLGLLQVLAERLPIPGRG